MPTQSLDPTKGDGEVMRQRKQRSLHHERELDYFEDTTGQPSSLSSGLTTPIRGKNFDDISKTHYAAQSNVAVPIMTTQSLSSEDKSNIVLLVFLYLLQGIPIGLAFGSVPFLLKQHLSFSDIGIFSIAQYPYSLKILWSPIVDAVFISSLGRRKSWIIPAQVLCGLLFMWIGSSVDSIIDDPEIDIYKFTAFFILLITCAATQDIAVDGWALDLLPAEHREYASTCQTIGLNCGYFLSFTVFLSFNSADFCNKFIRSTPSEHGMLLLGPYMQFWGVLSFLASFWLLIAKTERPTKVDITVRESYRTMWHVVSKPNVRKLCCVLLLYKIGFMANDAVSGLLLIQKGFKKEDLAFTVLLDFPCQIFLGVWAARWSRGSRPTRPWLYAQVLRLVMCIVAMHVVATFPVDGMTTNYFLYVLFTTLISSFSSTTMFVSQGAFFARISDESIGGSYLTLLNTMSNFGGSWPKYFVLKLVDSFTNAVCVLPDGTSLGECVTDAGKSLCEKVEGTQCVTVEEGYYPVSISCVIIGAVIFIFYVRPQMHYLEKFSTNSWKVNVNKRKVFSNSL
eukprot:CFRG1926T1